MKKIVQFYSGILILCSSIGFVGHFLQFGVWRITPWIPASIGILILLLTRLKYQKAAYNLIILTILGFGGLVTNMCLKFWGQGFQPIRKLLIFSMMAFSSWISLLIIIGQKKQ
jgi:hypothetical protein